MSVLHPDQFDEPHYSFDVTVSSHDDLKNGVTEKKIMGSQHSHHRIALSKEYSEADAHLIAAQMAYLHTGYVTGVYRRI